MISDNGINLLADKRKPKHRIMLGGRLKIFRISAIFILFATGVFSVILSILIIFSPLAQLKKDEQKARSTLSAYNLDINKIVFINSRGNSIRDVMKTRSAYERKIDLIESKLPADVTFDGVTIVKNAYTFRFSSKNAASLGTLVNSIVDITGKNKDFLRIYLTSMSTDQEAHRFDLVLDLLSV